MLYGLYLSANGVLANSHRQDVIANNLANIDNVGFKRDVASFQQRLTEAQLSRLQAQHSNPLLAEFSGGLLPSSVSPDMSQGELEGTGNNLDVAINGRGFFAVQDGKNSKQTALTRDGRLAVDKKGFITLADGSNRKVLDQKMKPIQVDPTQGATLLIGQNGEVSQSGEQVAQLGVFDVADPENLIKLGGSLLRYTGSKKLQPANATLRAGSIELSNVDSASELVQLMDAQRQLEANANMIRYQDQTLGRLVNDVGKIT